MHPSRFPIGEDHLQFKNDPQIMEVLGDKGKLAPEINELLWRECHNALIVEQSAHASNLHHHAVYLVSILNLNLAQML